MTNIINTIFATSGVALSYILFVLVTIDTILALKIKVPRGKMLSKTLIRSTIYNYTVSSIPLICDIVDDLLLPGDEVVITFLSVIIFTFLGIGILSSIIVNYAIAFPRAKFIIKIVRKFLPDELQNKLEKLDDEDVFDG